MRKIVSMFIAVLFVVGVYSATFVAPAPVAAAFRPVSVTSVVGPAWEAPTLTDNCAPDVDHVSITVNLSGDENNYDFQWSYGPDGSWTTVNGVKGDNILVVPTGTGDLYVRWASDHSSIGHITPSTELCVQPTPTPTATATAGPLCDEVTFTVSKGALDWSVLVWKTGSQIGVMIGGPFDNVGDNVIDWLSYGTYNYQFEDGDGNPVGDQRQFTIEDCQKPLPLLPVVSTTCEKIIVTFSDSFVAPDAVTPNAVFTSSPDEWELIVEPGDLHLGDVAIGDAPFQLGDNALSVPPGTYTWGLRFNDNGTWTDEASDSIVVGACATPSPSASVAPTASPTVAPTASPTAKPTAVRTSTPPPTNGEQPPSNTGSIPLLALLICFSFGGLGLLAVQAQRRAIR